MGEAPARKCDCRRPTSPPEPHVSSSYPVPSHAVPVSAGMMIAVPLDLVASPLRNGRDLGEADRSALVIGGAGEIRTGGAAGFREGGTGAAAEVRRGRPVRG